MQKFQEMSKVKGKPVKHWFENVSDKEGVKTWRIQEKKLVVQAKCNFGTFHSAEIYILLKSEKVENITRRSLYLWIGKDANENDASDATQLLVHADSLLNRTNIYIQHQNKETRYFLDLFPHGITYLKGQADEFKHFENGKYIKRLFCVKGKRNVRIMQVECKTSSLNNGDSFILDGEWTLYCWNGSESNKMEKMRAIETAREIRDQLCYGKARIIVIDAGVDIQEEEAFFRVLEESGGDGAGSVQSKIKDNREELGTLDDCQVTLYRVTDGKDENITERPLDSYLLNSHDCYLLDMERFGLFGWIGSRCKKSAAQDIISFIESRNSTNEVEIPIHIMREGRELNQFKMMFPGWTNNNDTESTKEVVTDYANGKIKIWRIEGFGKVEWPKDYYGFFYDGDCYLVLYESIKTKQKFIYIWQGEFSSSEERQDSFHFASELDTSTGGQTIQVTVVHGNEPQHFLRIFKGKFIVLSGGVEGPTASSRSTNVFDRRDGSHDEVKLFHIQGTNLYNTSARQVKADSSKLISDDAFLLQTTGTNFIWEGKFASSFEKDFAEVVADRIAPDGDLLICQEGFEPQKFKQAIGGMKPYNKQPHTNALENSLQTTRVYHCSDESGEFVVNEVFPFDQKDLNSDDVMIVDNGSQVYVWVGRYANRMEKEKAWETAQDFVRSDPGGRKLKDTAICNVKEGHEPRSLTDLFGNWDPKLFMEIKSYEQLKKQVQQENSLVPAERRQPPRPVLHYPPKSPRTPRAQRVLHRYPGNREEKVEKKQDLKPRWQ